MNTSALLALIADLYSQVVALTEENTRLKAIADAVERAEARNGEDASQAQAKSTARRS